MKLTRLTASAIAIAACAALSLASSALAQVVATQRAGQGLPPGQIFAPSSPGGLVIVGSDVYVGDGVQGLRHFIPADPLNADPVNSGTLVFDTNQAHSLGGGTLCFLFCQVGQIAFDGSQNVYWAAYDHQKGGQSQTFPGVWRGTAPSALTSGEWTSLTLIAPNAGLAGNQPTAVALGPDGKLYVGFLKNGDIVRISNPQLLNPDATQVVQKIGSSPNGRPLRALAFVGSDLYLGTSDSLAVIKNATAAACTGGCNAVAIADGFGGTAHVGLATDGINRIYMAINGQGVWRYTISTGTKSVVATGGVNPTLQTFVPFAFVGGHSNLLLLDRLGNLWIGDDTSDGAVNNAGRLWSISAGALSTLPSLP